MAVLRHAGLTDGLDREMLRPYMNTGFPWHEPEKVREHDQTDDEWWRALEPVLVRAIRGAVHVSDERANELAKEVRAV